MSELPSHFGPYQILSPLAAGGMGQVYRGRDTRLQRFVAIKVLHDAAAVDPDRQRRFAQEAIAASALNHPNILTVYDVGAEGDAQYLVSELIDGVSLRTEMNRERMPLKPVKDLVGYMAEAVLTDLPFRAGDRVIAMVSGMGGTPPLELYLMYRELELVLRAREIAVPRRLVGNYITSLDMAGCAITLLRADDELLSLWDDPVLTPALRWGI